MLDSGRWRGRDLEYRVGRIVRYSVFLYRHEGGLIRALALHARNHPEQVTAGQKQRRATLYDRLTDLLLECRDEITHPNPETAIRLGLFFVAATCRDKILFADAPHPRSLALDDRSLATELTSAFLAYTQADRPRKDTDHVR